MYDMINASETNVNGITTEAKLNILLGYMNAASATNYTNQVEPAVFKLITSTDNATRLGYLEEIRYKALLWSKDATNAAAIIALLTDSYSGDAQTATAVAAVKVHRDKLVAFTQSTAYSSSSDTVSTAILEAKRGCFLIKNWGITDYNAAIQAFTAISNL